MAPSKAMGKLKPRPRKIKLLASTFWQPMSHILQSPTTSECSEAPSCFNARDSRSMTFWIWSGISSSFARMASRSASDNVPLSSPNATANNAKAATVEENTLVDATPTSSPATTLMQVSLSRAMEESTSFTTPTVNTLSPLALSFTCLKHCTDSAVSPEPDTTMKTSPERVIGLRYTNSEANSTVTGILAICSIMYSATIAAWYEEPLPTIVNLFAHRLEHAAITCSGVLPSSPCVAGKGISCCGSFTE
mmetsp:Transcript_30742/g.88781  ORF Transcript_30742/g.88781 Transcript_30742/m.88781 type:complete len:249 (+) Transcript_30742:635-1381(+)